MAERRMFSKTIIDSDLFLDMSLSTQCLYFHLSMRADDDGFVNNPKKIQRMLGAGDDELKMLIAKNFIIPFETGICVIKHWRIHNFIRADRYKPTLYQGELEKLELDESKEYDLRKSIGRPDDNQRSTQVRLGKDREGKVKLGSSSSENLEEEIKGIMDLCQCFNYKLKKVDAVTFIQAFGVDKVKKAISIATTTNTFRNGQVKDYRAYLASTLQDLAREKSVEIKINKSNSSTFNNYQMRERSEEDYEDLMGFDN